MIAEITAVWTAVATTSKAIKKALETVHDVETKQAISGILDSLLDVQAKLAAAQAQYEALAEVKRELEQKVVKQEAWESESARYELKQLAVGIFVYALKINDRATGEPTHWLCPNCFQQGQKSILTKPAVDHLNYKCYRCAFDITPVPYPHFESQVIPETYSDEF